MGNGTIVSQSKKKKKAGIGRMGEEAGKDGKLEKGKVGKYKIRSRDILKHRTMNSYESKFPIK